MSLAGFEVLSRVARELGVSAPLLPSPDGLPTVPLPSRLATGDLASASVAAVALVSGVDPSRIDGARVAASYRSDRHLSLDGSPPSVWSPYSGFWRTGDGWIRTHGNYPHHAAALLRGLGLTAGADADALASVLSASSTSDSLARITAAGGLAVSVDHEDDAADGIRRAHPLLDVRRVEGTATRARRNSRSDRDGRAPLSGIRVLDLTRVIAGPVATRTLAVLGADVLRIDPPMLPEAEWQHLDTGHGKRTALLDARSPRMIELIEAADVVVLGYRPAAIARLGLSPRDLLARNPRLVIGQLSAWGEDQPDAAGFDSLVQAASGISWIESPDGIRPGALPAQALDHSAGYLLAAAVTSLIREVGDEGRSSIVRTSLRRVAAELLGMPRRAEPAPDTGDRSATGTTADHTARFLVDGRRIVTARSALPGFEFEPPHAWGSDHARW